MPRSLSAVTDARATVGLPVRVIGIAIRVALVFAVLGCFPLAVDGFEVPKIALVRVLGLGILAAALVSRPARAGVRWNVVDLAVLVWLAVEVAATAFSVAPRISVLGSPYQHEGLLTSTALVGIYLGLRLSHRSSAAFRATLGVFLAAAAVACLYALAQVAHLDPLPWLGTAVYAGGYVRPSATLGHPNLLGVVGAAACTAATALALLEGRRRWILAFVALLGAGAVVVSLSRAAWIALPLGTLLGCALVWSAVGGVRVSRRALAIGAVLVALAAVVLAAGPGGRVLVARASELLSSSTGSGAARVEIWRAALAAWQARPLLGHGPDTFDLIYPRFQTPVHWRLEWLGSPFHAHSIVLHTLGTRGILGLLAGVFAGAALARAWWRVGRDRKDARAQAAPLVSATVAVALCGLFGAVGINGALVIVLTAAFLAAALEAPELMGTTAAEAKAARSRGTPMGRPAPRPWFAPGCGVAVSLLVAWAELIQLRGAFFARSADMLTTRAPAEAVVAARLATRTMPLEDLYERYHVDALRALIPNVADRGLLLDEAERAARRAIALTPGRAACHLRLAAVYADRAGLGDPTAVAPMEAAFRSAMQLAPVDIRARLLLAHAELRLGRLREALAWAQEATRIDSAWALPYAAAARARIGLGDLDGARTDFARSLRSDWRGNAAARADAEQQMRSLGRSTR